MDDRELASVAAVAKVRRYAKDDVIFHADESGDIFCLIKEGQVKVTMISPEGKEIILSLLGPGDFFGEMALLDNEPRSATVVATEPLEVVTIWRSDFLQILQENFGITRKVLAELSRRLRNASNRIESLATMDVYGRLARFFLDLAAQSGKHLDSGYVSVQRPTTRNTPAEQAQFEVPGYRWADISDDKHGFSRFVLGKDVTNIAGIEALAAYAAPNGCRFDLGTLRSRSIAAPLVPVRKQRLRRGMLHGVAPSCTTRGP